MYITIHIWIRLFFIISIFTPYWIIYILNHRIPNFLGFAMDFLFTQYLFFNFYVYVLGLLLNIHINKVNKR